MFLRVNAPKQQGSPRIHGSHPYRPLQERVLVYYLVLDAIQTLDSDVPNVKAGGSSVTDGRSLSSDPSRVQSRVIRAYRESHVLRFDCSSCSVP